MTKTQKAALRILTDALTLANAKATDGEFAHFAGEITREELAGLRADSESAHAALKVYCQENRCRWPLTPPCSYNLG